MIEIHGAVTGMSEPVPVGAQLRAFLFAVPAVAAGIIGHRRARHGDASNGATARAGLITGLTGITINTVAIASTGLY